jgi:glutathione S-transferase
VERIDRRVYRQAARHVGCRYNADMPRRRLIHATFLTLLPLLVAAFGLNVLTAALLVVGMLLWRWLIVLAGLRPAAKSPPIVLETMAASHFVEKVRWCMDRLGIGYLEHQSAGTLGAFFAGRTVPQLRARTGLVETVIGNSPEILRYLWGVYAAPLGERAAFLAPTTERLRLERRLDRYGVNLQVWVYHHVLSRRNLTLHVWGADSPRVPAWQRLALRALYPLLAALIRRAFAITPERYAKSVSGIEELLGDIEMRLADGRRSILGGDEINYTDITFAAFSGLWLQPAAYAGGQGEDTRMERDRMPAGMRADIERWLEDYPKATISTVTLYERERLV